MDGFVVVLLIALVIWSRARKNQQKQETKTAPQRSAQTAAAQPHPAASAKAPARQLKPAAPAAVKVIKKEAVPAPVQQLSFDEIEPDEGFAHVEEHEGSIVMPPHEPHEHEGKPMPCPAEEREKPRPRPSQLAEQKPAAAQRPALQLSFHRNGVVQGVVMAEVLKRPQFQNGRRIYR